MINTVLLSISRTIDGPKLMCNESVELDTLETAIQTVINGHVNDMGIPNVIQELRDDDQHTRDMITALEAQLNELKHTLRYYETCIHTHDCHAGQRCNKHSECLRNEASVV